MKNFWRNKFLSFATIVVMAVIIFIFNIILAIQFIGNQAIQSLSERVDIVIYLRSDIDNYNAQKITEEIQKIEGVKNVKYTSKEDALQIVAKTHPQTAEFLTRFNLDNPLPPSISITTKNPEDHPKIREYLNTSQFAQYFDNLITGGGSGESIILSSVAKNLENISAFVKQIIFWMVFVFILGGTLIIINAIQLTIYSRKKEIHIMRLVGATPGFIRLPYIFEAVLYGVCAVILSFLILIALSYSVHLDNINLFGYYQEFSLLKVFFAELAITFILTIISSLSATEHHIKGKLILH